MHARAYPPTSRDRDRTDECWTLRYKKYGYFVDLAASDGIAFNNSWVLEKKWRWDGIVIEPNPYLFLRLKELRRARAFSCAVDEREGNVRFRIDNLGRGGIDADDTLNKEDQLAHAEVVSLPARTLTALLDEANAPSTIDYLSLDVEGAELRVLRGLDFAKYTFYCVTVERPGDAVSKILLENGYEFVRSNMVDAFFIHQSHPYANSIQTLPFESMPCLTE